MGEGDGHDRMARTVGTDGKEAARDYRSMVVALYKRMENSPEGREQGLRTALEKLAATPFSYVPDLTDGWLEVLNDGEPHATAMPPSTASGSQIMPSEDDGPV